MSKWLWVIGLFVVVAGGTYVYASSGDAGGKPSPDAGPSAQQDKLQGIVASIGSSSITQEQLYEEMLRRVGAQTLQEMVIRELVDEQAEAHGMKVDEEELQAGMDGIRKSFSSEEEFQSYLSSSGVDEEGFRKQVRMQLQLGKLFETELAVSEEEIRSFYELNQASFHHEEQVRVSHLLVKTKEQADELYKELEKGTDFAELAKPFSADVATRDAGGDMGFLSPGQWEASLEKVAFTLKTGDYSEPLESAYGYHLLKVTDRKPESTETVEQAKERIVDLNRQQRLNELIPDWLAGFLSSGEVKVLIPNPDPAAPSATSSVPTP